MRKKNVGSAFLGLLIVTSLTAMISAILAITLRVITEKTQDRLFEQARTNSLLFFVFPVFGFALIFLLRKFIFHNKTNKGIKEIYNSIENRKQTLPAYKVPSHYINGFLTVIFGGSTGIEVSTVVATAAIGEAAFQRSGMANKYKTEIVAAAVAAGITALFSSPITGVFFAVEAIARKTSKTILISALVAVVVSAFILRLAGLRPLFELHAQSWPYYAVPFILGFSIISGFVSVCFTKICLFIKNRFAAIGNNKLRVGVGALVVGIVIFLMPQLYGDSYHAVKALFVGASHFQFSASLIVLLLGVLIIKPIVASVTLGAGGDGGVFAPSLVIVAFLGLSFSLSLNHFFGTHLIPVNFMIIGMAAVLSGCIHAPFTALALMSTFSAGTIILVPLIIGSFTAKYIAKRLYPYTVYSYKGR